MPLLCPQGGECSDTFSTFDVPIFTEEFLDQNKGEGLGCGVGGCGILLGGWLQQAMPLQK